jgi:hypothetical protein
MSQNNPYLEFAQRHSITSLSTLNAYTALFRVHDLLYDMDELSKAIKALKDSGETKGRRHSWFQITSYYSVALITCLEWHARSRITDLLTFKPSSISSEDLKGQISDKLLSQMTAQSVTVPQLIGAMTAVGSANKYISLFQKIFSELAIKPSIREILNPIILEETHGDERQDKLQAIFDYRNRIVHEIDFSLIGPWVVRSDLDVDEARAQCQLVLSVIQEIESRLNQQAPSDFPNRLTVDFLPEDDVKRLDGQIATLENEITNGINSLKPESESNHILNEWLKILTASRASHVAEIAFIENADFIPRRHLDFRLPLQMALRRQRLEFLELLRSELP